MTLTQKLLKIDSMFNGEGGVAFIKIKAHLEDVERLANNCDPLAQKFSKSLDDVYRFILLVTS